MTLKLKKLDGDDTCFGCHFTSCGVCYASLQEKEQCGGHIWVKEPVICIDCEFYTKYRDCRFTIFNEVFDPVTGERLLTPKDPLRMRECEAYCGAEGKWFKLKEK